MINRDFKILNITLDSITFLNCVLVSMNDCVTRSEGSKFNSCLLNKQILRQHFFLLKKKSLKKIFVCLFK